MCGCNRALGPFLASAMTPSKDPAEIEYKRWRSKRQGYVVVVLGVHHRRGEHGYFSTVLVQGSNRDKDKRVTWPAQTFLRTFEPLGRKLKIPTRWDRLKE